MFTYNDSLTFVKSGGTPRYFFLIRGVGHILSLSGLLFAASWSSEDFSGSRSLTKICGMSTLATVPAMSDACQWQLWIDMSTCTMLQILTLKASMAAPNCGSFKTMASSFSVSSSTSFLLPGAIFEILNSMIACKLSHYWLGARKLSCRSTTIR